MAAEEVFLSYAHQDKQDIARLVEQIEGRGLSVFWDVKLRVGENWGDQLEEKLTTALAVVVVWTKNSERRDFVKSEARRAKAADKYFPVVVHPVDSQPLGLDVVQQADLSSWDDEAALSEFLEQLTYFLDSRRPKPSRAEVSRAGTAPLTRAVAQTVDRTDQLEEIEQALEAAELSRRPQCFAFECTLDDWPNALASSVLIRPIAEHLDEEISAYDIEPTTIEIAGLTAKAVDKALRSKLVPLVQDGMIDFEAWFAHGSPIKVIYTSLNVAKSVPKAQAQLLAISDYAESLALSCGAQQVVFLTACFTSDLGFLDRLRWKRALDRAKHRGLSALPRLDGITGADTDGWVNGFPASWQHRFDVDALRRRLWERVGAASSRGLPYRQLEPDIVSALSEAARDPLT